MKRWFWISLALLVCAPLAVQADYIVIKLNLAPAKDKEDGAAGPQNPVNPPGMGGPGMLGRPGGGQLGQAGGGALLGRPGGGQLGGGQLQGGQLGRPGGGQFGQLGQAGGGQFGQQGAGQLGQGGGALLGRPGGGQLGQGGGALLGRPGGGQLGQAGGALGQGGGALLGRPGGGAQGMGGGGMMGMLMGGMGPGMGASMMSQSGDEDEEALPIFVGCIVEVEPGQFSSPRTLTDFARLTHKWGKARLPHQTADVEWYSIKMPGVAKRFELQKAQIKEDDPSRAEKLLKIAEFAISHGLADKVPEIMDELARLDPKSPAVVAFQKIKSALARKVTRDDERASATLKNLQGFRTKSSQHYTLYYDVREDEADSRLARLEAHFKAFYYWFAIRGRELNVPDYRLLTLLVNGPEHFEEQYKNIFDSAPTVADGYHVRRENLAVFSNNRLDQAYQMLQSASKPMWTNLGILQGDALKGEARPNRTVAGQPLLDAQRNELRARAETVALVIKAMESEAELAAVTHEGTRQLIVASGLLPRNVQPPTWLDSGLASFFETPKGAFWGGTGMISLIYHSRFKAWMDTKHKNLEKPSDALRGVVTDKYFHEASTDPRKRDGELLRARVMAWELLYYLAEKHRDGLWRYVEEVSNLPRDLALDSEALLELFARSFNLTDSATSQAVDPEKWRAFADGWFRFMKDVPVEVDQVLKEARDSYLEKAKKRRSSTYSKSKTGKSGGGGTNIP